MATKMKKYRMGGPGDEVTGSEQGKGSNIARKLGTIIPSIGAAAIAAKATIDKVKANREKKKLLKAAKDATMTKAKVGGAKLSKYQKKGEVKTPFQNYMNVPGAMASDTSDVFTGNRDGSNPVLDKAYYDTYYAGQENKRRKGADVIKYDTQGNRIGKQTVHKTGGATKMYKTGGMVNANAKITAAKKATGKSGGTTKAISKTAVKSASPKGKVGGTSKAPKKASPVKLAKAKMGGMKGKSC